MNHHDAGTAPRAAYDKSLAFKICDRYGNGESLDAILAQPGMPDEETFFHWLDRQPEAARQFGVKQKLRETLEEQRKVFEREFEFSVDRPKLLKSYESLCYPAT